MACIELSSRSCAEISISIDLRRVSPGISVVTYLKEVKPLVVYDGEQGNALEPMQGNRAKSRVDLGYTVLFHIPAVTSVSF